MDAARLKGAKKDQRLDSLAIVPLAPHGRALGMPAELSAHSRQQLIGEVGLAARAKPRKKRRAENGCHWPKSTEFFCRIVQSFAIIVLSLSIAATL